MVSTEINGTPDLAALKEWLGLVDPEDTIDDDLLASSLAAALATQRMILAFPLDEVTGEPYYSDDLTEAAFLRAQRLASRRNSPSGVIGIESGSGDFVAARVPSGDPDVLRLEGGYLRIPVA